MRVRKLCWCSRYHQTESKSLKLFSCFRWCSCLQTNMNNTELSSVKTGVRNLTKKVGKKALTWTIIYFWGYFGLGLGWLSVPLMLSILRWFYEHFMKWEKTIIFKISEEERNSIEDIFSSVPGLGWRERGEILFSVMSLNNKNN